MEGRVSEILDEALAVHTRGSYNTAWSEYSEWAVVHMIDPLPLVERNLCVWVVWMTLFVSVSTLHLYLYGLQSVSLEAGYTCSISGMRLLERVMRGLKRRYRAGANSVRRPLTTVILAIIRPFFNFSLHDHRCMWAAACAAVYSLWRAGEFLASSGDHSPMLFSHMKKVSADHVEFTLPRTKTDVFRHGVVTHLFRTNGATCPVAALDWYLSHSSITLFSSSALFTLSSGRPLDRSTLISFIQASIDRAHIPNSHLYNGISFRKGGASSLAAAGVPDRVIKAAGRWRSDCFQLYVTMSLRELSAASVQMASLSSIRGGDDRVWGVFDTDRLFHDAHAEAEASRLLGDAHQRSQ
ncbi:MAG TPA: hypothetical protein V6C97_26375 [Oculatellaceae cyanobacterium]